MAQHPVLEVPQSATLRIADHVRRLERNGKEIIKLQTGDPDFATHPSVIESAHRAMIEGHTHYSNTRGLPLALRQAIATKLARQNRIFANPDSEIVITHGGVHGIYCTVSALVQEGDEVIIISPAWMPYISATMLAGAKPIIVEADPSNQFSVLAGRIQEAITPRTRMIIINTPCNPSGYVWTEAELRQIAKIAIEKRLYLLTDEVYEDLIYENSHVSIAAWPDVSDLTVSVFSFSKSYAMSGWRIGYLTAKEDILTRILKLSQYSITNLAPFVQIAAQTALVSKPVADYVDLMRTVYMQRRDKLIDALHGSKLK